MSRYDENDQSNHYRQQARWDSKWFWLFVQMMTGLDDITKIVNTYAEYIKQEQPSKHPLSQLIQQIQTTL